MTEITAPPSVNVLDPDFYVDPWDAYQWLRDEAPVWPDMTVPGLEDPK